MSVLLDDSNLEYLKNSNASVSAAPLTLACWFKSDDLSVQKVLVSICNRVGDLDYFSLRAASTASGQIIRANARRDTTGSAISADQYSNNTWHHAGGVFQSTTARYAYLDGVPGNVEATNVTPAGISETGIGCLYRSNIVFYMSGRIAELGIWNINLSTEEMEALAKGVSPLLVRPKYLVAYYPLFKDNASSMWNDRVGGYHMAEDSTPAASPDHPYIIRPSAPINITYERNIMVKAHYYAARRRA
ncbi:hypothetical protein LCGC14_1272450 [marine sediment metagenome]|uniref:LamG-like jellyroll fold domain-containing protein n=1 Tax=marine sediment metagenome TaxID=412755 RepID=A0A0F9KZI4_9ZZZZ